MSGTVRADSELVGELAAFFADQQRDAAQARAYLGEHCGLDDSVGVLLSMLRPNYDAARDTCEQAFDTVAGSMGAMATQLQGYQHDVQTQEQDVAKQEVVPSSVELRWRPDDHQAAFTLSS